MSVLNMPAVLVNADWSSALIYIVNKTYEKKTPTIVYLKFQQNNI